MLAPIALFVYKRPEHTLRTLQSLARNPLAKESVLYVFSDGPKSTEDQADVDSVRELVRSQKWCGEVHLIEAPQNKGLYRSITEGVKKLCDEFGHAIVLEDDLELAPGFLKFLNQALEKYKNDPEVFQATGYCYPVDLPGKHDAFFISHGACWGWATWKRAWDHFYTTETLLPKLEKDPVYRRHFDIDDSYPYYELLKMQAEGKVDSWGVRWYETIQAHKGLLLMPRKSLVKNTGMDGSGTHKVAKRYEDKMEEFSIQDFPPVVSDQEAYNKIASFFRGQRQGRVGRLKETVKRFLFKGKITC